MQQLLKNNLDNLCIAFGTLAAFCVGQGLFWVFVGSKQFETLMKNKIEIAELFLSHDANRSLKALVCYNLRSMVSSEDVEMTKKNEMKNLELIKTRFYDFFAFTFSFFAFTLVLVIYNYKKELNMAQSSFESAKILAKRRGFFIGLFLVLFSFSTEIFIFMYIIKPYIVIGDLEIMNLLV